MGRKLQWIGNSTVSTEVSHLKSIITSTIFNFSALTEISPLSLDPKIETKINKKSALYGPIHNLKIHRHKHT